MKKIIFYMMLICLFGTSVHAGEDLESRFKKYTTSPPEKQKHMLDASMRKDMYEFLSVNEDVPLKDFKTTRLAWKSSQIVISDLLEKYVATYQDYNKKITDKGDLAVFKSALKVDGRISNRAFLLCKNGDKESADKSFNKIRSMRKRRPPDFKSDKAMQINEQILAECRFYKSSLSALLNAYEERGFKEKFKVLMLRVVAEDQTDFDYFYNFRSAQGGLDGNFTRHYKNFIYDMKSYGLSKEQVKIVVKDLLTKHYFVFDPHSPGYYVRYLNESDEHAKSVEYFVEYNTLLYAIDALIYLSEYLRELGMEDLNTALIDKYFEEIIISETLEAYKSRRIIDKFYIYLKKRKSN